MPANDHDLNQPGAHDPHVRDSDHPGYEVNGCQRRGVWLCSWRGCLALWFIFFLLCYGLGVLINNGIKKQDGPTTKWNTLSAFAGAETTNGKRQDLASNPEMQQKEFQQMTSTFPEPRLDIDDGNQATADLHAREDLLLNNYSEDYWSGWNDSDSDLSRDGDHCAARVAGETRRLELRLSRWWGMKSPRFRLR